LPGTVVLEARGRDAAAFFAGEGGAHRWQRIPPTEKRGRVQTSTVTVAVLDAPAHTDVVLSQKDIHYDSFCAGGPGGQHQNRTASAVRAKHIPTGITVVCRNERCQHRNKAIAAQLLTAKVRTVVLNDSTTERSRRRREQVGRGMRSDKVRTYRVRDNRVTDHVTGRRTRFSKLRKGDWSDLKREVP
jgi:peptide chain release factor 1